MKTLGFLLAIIAHNSQVENQRRILPKAGLLLEALLGYAICAKRSKMPLAKAKFLSKRQCGNDTAVASSPIQFQA